MAQEEDYFRKDPKNKEGGVLVKLWRDLVHKSKLGPSMNVMINRYLNKATVNKVGGNATKKTRSSITKDISAEAMTFTTFLHLLFNLVGVKEMTISVKVTYVNNEEEIVSTTIPNPNRRGYVVDEPVTGQPVSTIETKDSGK